MFRHVIFLGMFVAAASMAGWFTINREGGETTIKINRSEIRDDASRAISRGRKYLDKSQLRVTDDQQNYRQQPYDDDRSRSQYQTNNQYPAKNQYPTADQYPTTDRYPAANYYPEANQYDARRYSDADYDPAGRTYRGPESQDYHGDVNEARRGVRYGIPGSPQQIR